MRPHAGAPPPNHMTTAAEKLRLRRRLDAHLADLGYTRVRPRRRHVPEPEIIRISPVRGHIAYGEVVLREDLELPAVHQRLLSFSQRRTRHRSSILFFIGIAERDHLDLTTLLEQLGIRNGMRGGHVHLVLLDGPPPAPAKPAATKKRAPKAKTR